MQTGSEAFREDERRGVAALPNAVFILVAGGLGERLGHDGIKVELPAETITCASFLQTYITALLAMQRQSSTPNRPIPLVIMTSADTHSKTSELLSANSYFGLDPSQLHFITQSNVPALSDASGKFAVDSTDPYRVQTKPHGHGDVHTLLYSSGLLGRLPPRAARARSSSRTVCWPDDTRGIGCEHEGGDELVGRAACAG